jgi:Fic family protein
LFISGYLEDNRDEYNALLGALSSGDNWNAWLDFFLNAVVNQSLESQRLVGAVLELHDYMRNRVPELLRSKLAGHVVDALFDAPAFAASTLHERLGITRDRAARYIRILRDNGLLSEARAARGRSPAILAFAPLLQIARGDFIAPTERRSLIPPPP